MKKTAKERGIILSCLLSQGVWLIAAIVLLLLFCAAAYSTADPDKIILPLSLCALYLSGIIGGAAAVRFSGDGIVSGLLSGALTAVIVFALSCLPFPADSFIFPTSLLLNLLVVPASALGSLIGRKRKKSRPRSGKRAAR